LFAHVVVPEKYFIETLTMVWVDLRG